MLPRLEAPPSSSLGGTRRDSERLRRPLPLERSRDLDVVVQFVFDLSFRGFLDSLVHCFFSILRC
jgi:hypothetical protein